MYKKITLVLVHYLFEIFTAFGATKTFFLENETFIAIKNSLNNTAQTSELYILLDQNLVARKNADTFSFILKASMHIKKKGTISTIRNTSLRINS